MTKRKPVIHEEHLINELKKPQLRRLYPDIKQLDTPLDQSLLVLWILKEQFPVLGYVPSDIISYILKESFGIRLSTELVTKALSKAGNRADPKKSSGETYYKIMESGIDHLQSITNKEKTLVYHVGGKTPYTDFKILVDVIKSCNSEIKIVDPYYGLKTLENLEKIQFGKPIKL